MHQMQEIQKLISRWDKMDYLAVSMVGIDVSVYPNLVHSLKIFKLPLSPYGGIL